MKYGWMTDASGTQHSISLINFRYWKPYECGLYISTSDGKRRREPLKSLPVCKTCLRCRAARAMVTTKN